LYRLPVAGAGAARGATVSCSGAVGRMSTGGGGDMLAQPVAKATRAMLALTASVLRAVPWVLRAIRVNAVRFMAGFLQAARAQSWLSLASIWSVVEMALEFIS